jgi:hypothetical protein
VSLFTNPIKKRNIGQSNIESETTKWKILLSRKQLYGIQKVILAKVKRKFIFKKKKKKRSFAPVPLEEMAQRHSAQVRFPCPTDFFLGALGPVKLLIMPKFLSKLYNKKKCQY